MRKTATVSCLVLLFSLGCYSAPIKPPAGAIYTNFKAPLQTDFDETKISSKTGIASTNYLALWYFTFSWGDAEVEEAARNGQLKQVNYVDYEYLNVLGIYNQFSVIAHGE